MVTSGEDIWNVIFGFVRRNIALKPFPQIYNIVH